MDTGTDKLPTVLQRSPHDEETWDGTEASSPDPAVSPLRCKPSRYNVRALARDGRLVLWNSYRRSLSVFDAEQRPGIEDLLGEREMLVRPGGMAKYLFDRGFLVKQDTNEYRRIQLAFGQYHYRSDTLQLTLLASEDCNFRCRYCYEEFARGTMQPWVRAAVRKLVEKRAEEGLRHLSVNWFGGEPLYGLCAIEELAPFFLDIAHAKSLHYSSGMTTNGYLLTPEVAEKLLAWRINRFQITVDGPPDCHDRNRPARDGQGTFWTIFSNLKALRRFPDDYEVSIRINWDSVNFPRVGELLDLIEQEFRGDGRFRVRFHTVFASDIHKKQLEVCGLDEAIRMQWELEREGRRRGLDIGDDLRHAKPVGSGPCYAARPYHFVIGAGGKVMKCTVELDMTDRNVVGRLSRDGDLDLDYEKMALWCEPAFERDAKCQACVILPLCLGMSCPSARFVKNTSPCIPLRRNLKEPLRAVVEGFGDSARKVRIDAPPGPALQAALADQGQA